MILDPATCEPMSPSAASAFMCYGCDTYLSHTAERMLLSGFPVHLCECEEESEVKDLEVHVIPSSVQFLDADVVRQAVWYHATAVENWEEKVSIVRPTYVCGSNEMLSVPYIHVGTFDAAMERFNDSIGGSGWLYEIRIKDEAVLAEEVYEDSNDWEKWVRTGFFEGVLEDRKQCDAIRYVNRWESVGSISLIMDPRFIEVVKVSPLKKDMALPKPKVAVCA